MKPFDLEAAKRGEPIVTRDGREAKFIAHVPDAIPQHQVLVLQDREVVSLHVNGRYSANAAVARDIFMATKKRTVWVNLYHVFYTEEDADAADTFSNDHRIGGKAYPVEIEE